MAEGLTSVDIIKNLNGIAEKFWSMTEEATRTSQKMKEMMTSLSSWSVVIFQ